MKREARLLQNKAVDSLILSIEHFNRPYDRGRVSTALILLDHAFEMLLKAAILQRGGKIREKNARETIGFNACVGRALSDGAIRFLDDDQALTLQTVNGLRDAAQHHLLDISEEQFYLHVQAGVTLFRDLLKTVFRQDLSILLPGRVLPISTIAPTDISTLFDSKISEIKKLLSPKRRRRTEAYAQLRPLAIFDATIRGEKLQPSADELKTKSDALVTGKSWKEVFPGAASVELTANQIGPSISLRITKKEGIPAHLVPEGTPGAFTIGVRRVNELDYYNLGLDQLAEKAGLSRPKTIAIIHHLGLQSDPDCFKEIKIGGSGFKRYSQKAVPVLKKAATELNVDDVWKKYWSSHSKKGKILGA
jgi:hypothetical protein